MIFQHLSGRKTWILRLQFPQLVDKDVHPNLAIAWWPSLFEQRIPSSNARRLRDSADISSIKACTPLFRTPSGLPSPKHLPMTYFRNKSVHLNLATARWPSLLVISHDLHFEIHFLLVTRGFVVLPLPCLVQHARELFPPLFSLDVVFVRATILDFSVCD